MTELGTIDKTAEGAVSSGCIWNVHFEGLPAEQWKTSADILARHAPEVHDVVAPVYVEADQLNKLANNYTQGGVDELDEEVIARMRRFRESVANAVKALRKHAS